MTGRAKPGTRAPFFGPGRFRIAGHRHSVSRRTRAADEDVEVNEPPRAGSNHSRRARGHGAMFQPHDRGQGGRAQLGACVPRLPLGIQRARLVPPRRRPRRASVLVIEPDRPRTRVGPARVAASSRPVGSRLDRAGRIDTRRRVRDDARASRRPPPRPATLGRARTAAPSQPRTVRVENSRIAIRRAIRAAPKRNHHHPRSLRVHAKSFTFYLRKKKVSDGRVVERFDASSYRRLTATPLPPRASRLPPAFFPDDDARRTPRPGSTRRARAKSAPTRMTTKNPEKKTVWRRCKPRDARRSRSLLLHRKPTASTRASAISTSRVTRGHRFSRAS